MRDGAIISAKIIFFNEYGENMAQIDSVRNWNFGGYADKFRAKSFKEVMSIHNGVGPGFDLVRLGLALAIFYGHCHWVAGSNAPLGPAGALAASDGLNLVVQGGWEGPKRALHLMLVPMFFAVSGFLVAGSAERTRSVRKFLTFRALRIFPALTVEVMLSALLLGPALTSFTLNDYFKDPHFWQYFGNIVGFVTFELPGVFLHNPIPNVVNANLWTLTAEFYCYLLIAILIGPAIIFNQTVFSCALAAITIGLVIANSGFGFAEPRGPYPSHVAVYYFFIGCAFWLWRDRILLHPVLFVLACFTAYITLTFRRLIYIAPVPVTYIILAIGLMKPPRLPEIGLLPQWVRSVDYSYGVYLYGFPISQALVATVPVLRGHGWVVLFSTAALTFPFALVSWYGAEKPALRLKRYFAPQKATIPVNPEVRVAG